MLRYQSLCFHEMPDRSLCLNSDQLKTFGMDLEQHSCYLLRRCCHLFKSFPSESWNDLYPLDAALSEHEGPLYEEPHFLLMPLTSFILSFLQLELELKCWKAKELPDKNWTTNRQWNEKPVNWKRYSRYKSVILFSIRLKPCRVVCGLRSSCHFKFVALSVESHVIRILRHRSKCRPIR